LTVADINGDGEPDLIVPNQQGNTISVLLNTTAPGAAHAPASPLSIPLLWVALRARVTAADVNGDGKADLIVANTTSDSVSVLLNTTAPGAATPSFATQQPFAVGSQPFSVTAADLNGDGELDLIVANSISNTVSVLLNALYATTASGQARRPERSITPYRLPPFPCRQLSHSEALPSATSSPRI